MTATMVDALETYNLLNNVQIIPLALGSWQEVHKEDLTCEDIAFGEETPSFTGKWPKEDQCKNLYLKLAGQYTFRWRRALEAKKRNEFIGRAIVPPSRALEVLGWGRGGEKE